MLKPVVFLVAMAVTLWTALAPMSGSAASGGCGRDRIAQDVCHAPVANLTENQRDTVCAAALCQTVGVEHGWRSDPGDVPCHFFADAASARSVHSSWRPPRV